MKPNQEWGSHLGFILASIAGAIGLGNIWRFSYVAYEGGGGSFLLIYLIALFTTALPMLILEYGIGHKMQLTTPSVFEAMKSGFGFIGWFIITTVFAITVYYMVIVSWCLNYFIFAFTRAWGDNPEAFFEHTYLNMSNSPFLIGYPIITILLALGFLWLINWWIINHGLQNGLERASKIFMPILIIIAIILVIRGVTLPGAGAGIKWFLTPRWDTLLNPTVWFLAFSQIFFSVGLGMGMMINFGSFLPKRSNITRSSIIVALANSGFSIFIAFAVFGAIGHLATISNEPVSSVMEGGTGLAFVIFPEIINKIPFAASLFGVLFFSCLVVAGISSTLALVETVVSSLEEKFPKSRKMIVNIVALIGFLVGIFLTTRAGSLWIDILDGITANFSLLVIGLTEALVVGWLYGVSKLSTHLNSISKPKVGKNWIYIIKYFVPIVILAIFAFSFYKEFVQPVGNYPIIALIAIGFGGIIINIATAYILFILPQKPEKLL